MDKQVRLDEFKKEFSFEIDSTKVSMQDLTTRKVQQSILGAEVYLRKVFGDEIYTPKKSDDKVSGEKGIEKLTEAEVAFDSEVREICENIADEDFDNNIGLLLSKTGSGEK